MTISPGNSGSIAQESGEIQGSPRLATGLGPWTAQRLLQPISFKSDRLLGYTQRFKALRVAGYRIEIVYLRLATPQLALRRIAMRVRQGGHDVPKEDVLRRFNRSWSNFLSIYQPLVDNWTVYDNSGAEPQLLEQGP